MFCRKKSPYEDEDEEEEKAVEDETLAAFALALFRNISATSVSIIACHPFHVIAVRTMAQFIGQEQKYTYVVTFRTSNLVECHIID